MKRAFTFIELLVVIAIIAVLAALLFPVFAKARARANKTQCASNLRQLGTAMRLYMDDWEGRYPWGYAILYAHTDPTLPTLHKLLAGYVRSDDVWACPSDTGEVFMLDTEGFHRRTPPFWKWEFMGDSYLWPALHAGTLSLCGIAEGRVRSPSSVCLLFEARPWHGGYRPDELAILSPARYNVLCCDGHNTTMTKRERDTGINNALK